MKTKRGGKKSQRTSSAGGSDPNPESLLAIPLDAQLYIFQRLNGLQIGQSVRQEATSQAGDKRARVVLAEHAVAVGGDDLVAEVADERRHGHETVCQRPRLAEIGKDAQNCTRLSISASGTFSSRTFLNIIDGLEIFR